jgi:hypothetical protein
MIMARSKPNTSTMGVMVCSRTVRVSETETMARVALLIALSIVTFWLSSSLSVASCSNFSLRSSLSRSISSRATSRVDFLVKSRDRAVRKIPREVLHVMVFSQYSAPRK